MSNFKYPKGSEWRIWDLHVHTPASHNFSGTYEELITQINDSKCSVVGINDYATVEGYKKLLETGEVDKYLIPVVEFRMEQIIPNRQSPPLQGCRTNFHIIFNPDIDINKIDTFIKSIPFKDGEGCNRGGTKRIGDASSPEELIKVSVNFDEVINSLKEDSILKNNFLVWIPYNEHGGIDSLDAENSIKAHLINSADIIGSSNQSQIDFFLWKHERFSVDDFKKWMGNKKPCIKGSDSHKSSGPIGKLLDKDSNPIDKYCWIKADPSFNGLKQIIYEPEDRIKIQAEKPEEKKSYFIIDRVRFIDNTKNDDFGSDFIEISDNLTTIVGGKSTGKSLLLYYIARTIDKREVESRQLDDGSKTDYTFHADSDFDFEVIWKHGERTSLKTIDEEVYIENQNKKRKVLYIPQNYLNKLSEKKIESKQAINDFILGIFLQDEEIKKSNDNYINEIRKLNKKIPSLITELFHVKKEINDIEELLKKIGEKNGIEQYIKKVEQELNDIKKQSNLSAKESTRHEELQDKVTKINTAINNLKQDKETVEQYISSTRTHIESLTALKYECLDYFNSDDIKAEFKQEAGKFDKLTDIIEGINVKLLQSIQGKISKLQDELKNVNSELTPILKKVKLKNDLKKKMSIIKEENKKIDDININIKKLELKRKEYSNLSEKISENYKTLHSTYRLIQGEFKKHQEKFDDIILNVAVGFNSDDFNENVVNSFLKKNDLKKVIPNTDLSEEFQFKYSQSDHIENIISIYEGLLSEKVGLLKNKRLKDSLIKLFEDYFYIDFNIKYKNDSLDKMSPGKKGLVLLRILIDLSKEEWPILIDQPEDDLDNRSVYEDLVKFLKTKKKNRQIIIVTHNPNLVVGTDAEEIIVANQAGQTQFGSNRGDYRFEYVSGSLENSFEIQDPNKEKGLLYRKGIREHVCEVLEGGKIAFKNREMKYNLSE